MIHRLTGARQAYSWGSRTAIPDLLGEPAHEDPVAEVWFGAHASAPATLGSGAPLCDLIDSDPQAQLGQGVLARFGPRLPYLVKLIAPAGPLSLQVHPSLEQAAAGHAQEEAAGIPLGVPHRRYPDANHKPEMLFALEPFEAIAGFRTARRATELLLGLDTELARSLLTALRADMGPAGVRAAFTRLLERATSPDAAAVAETVDACAARLATGESPSVRADRVVGVLAAAFPGDVGAVASLLMNPVSLRAGEALFVPAGGVHCYLSGLGLEVMASSDNVLRAGLTSKFVDPDEVLRTVDWIAAPPVRVAPEHINDDVEVFYAPVDDFELAVATGDGASVTIPGRGPRVLISLDAEVVATHDGDQVTLSRGQAAFVPASRTPVVLDGEGRLAQITVP
ncbi:mannose-6-phosphate isomerase, class I [Pseudactinotalea terrae]|uniref:mannose-6-phosphate isomerase, class I n=1 Tax=Pseudactinotalea terrae TaxID=1743262 RepID=UPI0019D56EAC|nr:mannose-6-phosphate isomerase, class I [Pseudactinotalea terrae]